MKRIKKIFYFVILAVVFLTIGYFISAYTQFNRSIKEEVFMYGYYQTRDTSDFISFGDFKNTVLCVKQKFYFISDVSYDKGIFTLIDSTNDKAYKIGVIDSDIIYSLDFNIYFYNIDLWEERS